MDPERLDQLITFVTTEDRVCPLPLKWDNFWKRITRQIGTYSWGCPSTQEQLLIEWRVLKPLILNGWYASAADKRRRLVDQLLFTSKHAALLDHAERYLRGLAPQDWYLQSDTKREFYEPAEL